MDKPTELSQKMPEKETNLKENKPKDSKSRDSKEDEPKSSKKASMKTSMDVINRILWDEALPTEHFVVGYLDRFIGIIERKFSDFSWEDISSVDYDVLAIPKHRIHYFKYKNVVIWDKNERLDKVNVNVFPSLYNLDYRP